MNKELLLDMFGATLATHRGKIDKMFSKYKRLNPPDSEKITLDMLERIINLFRKKVDKYLESLLENPKTISKNKDFDTSVQSLENFKEMMLEYKEKLIFDRFPKLFGR